MNHTEFYVNGVVESGVAGTYRVIGRCGELPIRPGDLFLQIQYPNEDNKQVKLKIIHIQAYEHTLDEMSPALTGTLDVTGEGLEWLRPKAVLVAFPTHNTESINQLASQVK